MQTRQEIPIQISIIIPTKNSGKTLAACLNSINKQTERKKLRLLLSIITRQTQHKQLQKI